MRQGTLSSSEPVMSASTEPKSESAESTTSPTSAPTSSPTGDPIGNAEETASGEDGRIEIDEDSLLDAEVQPSAQDEVESLKEELATTKDRWLRAVADHENHKKRSKREMDEAVQRGVQKLLNDFLPVADNLERALEAVANRDERISEGIAMVKQVFIGALDKNGIVPVPGVGSRFDPAHHDAMQQVPSEEYAPGHVVMVFEGGYTRHGRLLRPAKVIVSDENSTGTKGEPQEAADSKNAEA